MCVFFGCSERMRKGKRGMERRRRMINHISHKSGKSIRITTIPHRKKSPY